MRVCLLNDLTLQLKVCSYINTLVLLFLFKICLKFSVLWNPIGWEISAHIQVSYLCLMLPLPNSSNSSSHVARVCFYAMGNTWLLSLRCRWLISETRWQTTGVLDTKLLKNMFSFNEMELEWLRKVCTQISLALSLFFILSEISRKTKAMLYRWTLRIVYTAWASVWACRLRRITPLTGLKKTLIRLWVAYSL